MIGRLVVVKVGGSLLDWPEFPGRLAAFLEARRADRLVLVVGGGRFADLLRDLDSTFNLGEGPSHALALRVLDLTAHLLAELVLGTTVVDEIARLEAAWSAGELPILAPRKFLDDDDQSPDPLPHAWTTTTDAIAARIAVKLGADELVLLKSVSLLPGINLHEAARLELVDPEFPRVAGTLPAVTFRNLREVSGGGLKERDPRPT